jgi:hypothetical protein
MCSGDELAEIPIAFAILRKEREMRVILHSQLSTQDRLDGIPAAELRKLHCRRASVVIRQRKRPHPQGGSALNQRLQITPPIQKTIGAVHMQFKVAGFHLGSVDTIKSNPVSNK